MLKLGKLELGRRPRIVASITGETSLSVLSSAPREGADIIEVRLDHFQKLDATSVRRKLAEIRHVGLPLIATVRAKAEGGAKTLSDAQRLRVYETALELVDCVDVELTSDKLHPQVVKLARAAHKPVILSYHNFEKTPSDGALSVIIETMREAGADICKLATLTRTRAELLRLFSLLEKHADTSLALIALGPLGKISRVAFPLFGSVLTYGFVDKPLAPGQLHVQQLRDQLRLYSETPTRA
jgi:3-dehydroquinate dehydratase-1